MMATNVALTGLARDMQARAETGRPIRIGLIGSGEMGTDIVTRVAHMTGIEIGAISELNLPALPRRSILRIGRPAIDARCRVPHRSAPRWRRAKSL